jgi:hypothetical protein
LHIAVKTITGRLHSWPPPQRPQHGGAASPDVNLGQSEYRGFIERWLIIRLATAPGPDCDRWHVDGIEWHRQRHTLSSDGCCFAIEIHRLHSTDPAKWSMLVVVEHWWGEKKEPLKSRTWVRRLSGNSTAIAAWARTHETVRRATAASSKAI